MFCGLFEGIGEFDEIGLSEQLADDLHSGREVSVHETHGHGDGGQAGVGRQDLAVVSGRTFHVTDFSWGVTPRRIDEGIDLMGVHRSKNGFPKTDATGIVVQVEAGRVALLRRRVILKRALQTVFDIW
jgi:hypothetical protein